MATVKDGVVTVKKGADGAAIITATVNDLQKASDSVVIDVRYHTPRVANSTVTINTATILPGEIQLLQAYDAEILTCHSQSVSIFTTLDFFNID